MTDLKPRRAGFWQVVIACAAMMAITTGIRLSLGLFVRPITATGISVASISLILAVGQFFWGAVQPLFGLLAARVGVRRVLVIGGVLLGTGCGLAPLLQGELGLLLTLGVMSAAGAGAASFAILIGAAAQHVPLERRAFASGLINAGGSFGQFVVAPLTQFLITGFGWAGAMWALAAAGFGSIFMARAAAGPERAVAATVPGGPELRDARLRDAFRDRSYWCLHAGFFTCGFHIAFLATHLPSEIALCGLPAASAGIAVGLIGLFNIGGSIGMGWLASRFRMKVLLCELYATRALVVVLYLLAPKSLTTLYVFAGALGLTWLATVPPTAGLVGKLYGTRHLSTLFGFTLLSHQVGAFFGAWLGGIALARTGSYQWVWYADVMFALFAAAANLPIREAVAGQVALSPARA